jgi:hypothetical protein
MTSLLAPRPAAQIWSVKKNEEAAAKKRPKMTAAQLRVQKGEWESQGWRGSVLVLGSIIQHGREERGGVSISVVLLALV